MCRTILGYHSFTTFTSRSGPLIATLHRHGSSRPTAYTEQYYYENLLFKFTLFRDPASIQPDNTLKNRCLRNNIGFAKCYLEFLNMAQMEHSPAQGPRKLSMSKCAYVHSYYVYNPNQTSRSALYGEGRGSAKLLLIFVTSLRLCIAYKSLQDSPSTLRAGSLHIVSIAGQLSSKTSFRSYHFLSFFVFLADIWVVSN